MKKRPQIVIDLEEKYPPGTYRVKPGAPYEISCPGTIVVLVSYAVNGDVAIVIPFTSKLPQAIEHEKKMCQQFGKSEAETEYITKGNCLTDIDPVWLEPVTAFSLGCIKEGREFIYCNTCHSVSYNTNDIINLYCANCDKFHV